MKAPEMTDELKNELQVIQMRSALDPKHFYKRSEMKSLPKYFEVNFIEFIFLFQFINSIFLFL